MSAATASTRFRSDEGEPALWNAFPGTWGAQDCILAGAYRDLKARRRAPAFQERYKEAASLDVVAICRVETGTASVTVRLERCD